MSGARSHEIKGGLIPLLDQCANAPPHDCWCVIFVIPNDGQVLKNPYLKSAEVQELRLFSVMMAMETKEIQRVKE
jgi:hypothetical protein